MHDTNLLDDQPIAWTPTPEVIERAQLTKFMRQVGVGTWDELYEFSIRDVGEFTEEVLKFLDIKFDPSYEKLLDTSSGIEFPIWFRSGDTPVPIAGSPVESSSRRRGGIDGAGLNITTMCLDRWQTDEMKNHAAVIWEGEAGESREFTYAELAAEVDSFAEKLCDLGINKGDAVGIHLPMVPETVVSLLAINRLGAIAVPVFSGYGIDAISSRMEAVGAKALITCYGTQRRGKPVDMLTIAARAVANVASVKSVIVTGKDPAEEVTGREDHVEARNRRRLESRRYEYLRNDLFSGRKVALWSVRSDTFSTCLEREPATTEAEDPLIILYTSGTTGKPKGIAHTHASFPIKAAQDMAFGTDVGKGTRISWYTDIGWMMGPWLIYGALINGATICIYDGAPDYPTADRMWEFCAKHKIEVLGISPTLIRSLARSGDTPFPIGGSSAESSSKRRGDVHGDKSVPAPSRKGWYRSIKLPHYDGEVTQFITFRLADSLPKGVLDRLRVQLERDKLTDDSEEYRQRVEDYLDQGAGDCILRRPDIARIVAETILYEDGRSCDLKAWVVMPNHGHLLLRMHEGQSLGALMKRIKGVSSRRINELRGGSGSVWQADYFDRYIRDAEHFVKALRYVENNPVVSGLSLCPEDWEFGSAYRSGDTLVPIAGSAGESLSRRRSGVDGDKSVPAPVFAPFERHDLSSLRIFASTGEPWNPSPWWWLFEKVGNSKLPIINYSGGTEIAGGILMGNPLLPIKPCSFPAPCPGMDVDILDEEGRPVGPGKVGELVIKQPWIGMARGFWQERERYLDTYWRRFTDIWVHGDFAMRDADGHWFILGRSDDTLKVAGKRVGPAEVESLLVAHPQVIEAAVIGVPDEAKGTAMVAFVVRSGDTPVPIAGSSGESESQRRSGVDGDKSVPSPSVPDGAKSTAMVAFVVRSGDTPVPIAGSSGESESQRRSGVDGDKSVPSPSVLDEAKGTAMAAFVVRSGDTPVPIAGSSGESESQRRSGVDGDRSVPSPLEAELKALVAKDMGKPLAPSKIHFVSALPKTRNAKVMRRVIRSAYLGEDPGDLSALENPQSVDEIAAINR